MNDPNPDTEMCRQRLELKCNGNMKDMEELRVTKRLERFKDGADGFSTVAWTRYTAEIEGQGLDILERCFIPYPG